LRSSVVLLTIGVNDHGWLVIGPIRVRPNNPVDQIIEDLYAGTLENCAWNKALVGAADLVRASGVFLYAVDPASDIILRDEIYRLDPATERAYRQHWISQDVRLGAAMSVPVGEPAFERKLALNEKWERTAIFNEFLWSDDIPYCLCTWLHKSPDKIVALSFQGTRRRGTFEEADAQRIKTLVPHLRRALAIRDRLESHKLHAETLSAAVGGMQFGVFVLDKGGCILEACGLAAELLRSEPGIRRARDRTLWLREPAGSQLLRWLKTGLPPEHNSNGLLRIPRSNGLRGLSALLTPMPRLPTTWTSGDPRWLVLVFDPERRTLPAADLISRDLGISNREAEVAAMLCTGCDLSNVALRLGISVHTARAHLKHIFGKTGIRSQNDLVRRIVIGPAAYAG
jgi:DNA-binding CsgD family transcriptional regulator